MWKMERQKVGNVDVLSKIYEILWFYRKRYDKFYLFIYEKSQGTTCSSFKNKFIKALKMERSFSVYIFFLVWLKCAL